MQDIRNLKKSLTLLIEKNNFININISIGNINKNKVMNHKIQEFTYNIYKKFIKSKFKKHEKKYLTEYYYRNLKLVKYNNNNSICIQRLPTDYFDYKINNVNKNKNMNNLRFELINNRIIDPIIFPSLEKYDNIEENEIDIFMSKFKDSEIDIKFIKNSQDLYFINFVSKIDKVNFNNFINNFQYLLSKFYFIKLKL